MFPKSFHQFLFYKKNERKTTLSLLSPPARRDPCWRAFTRGLPVLVFRAPHAYSTVPVWVLPTCWKLKVDALRHHMAKLCSNATFWDRHGILMLAKRDPDWRCSHEFQAALDADVAFTHPCMLEVLPFRSTEVQELGMGNFDVPHLMKHASHVLDKDGFIMHGEASYMVLHAMHKFCNKCTPELPTLSADKQEAKVAFDHLKASLPAGQAAVDYPAPPPRDLCCPGWDRPRHSICQTSRWYLPHVPTKNCLAANHQARIYRPPCALALSTVPGGLILAFARTV